MSSNTLLMDSTEDNNQEQKLAKTKVSPVDKWGYASTVTEKTGKLDSKKISVPSLDQSGSASKTEKVRTEKYDSKKRSVQLSSSVDKKLAGLDPKDMRIKILKSAHDDKNCSSMSVSLEIGPIPRMKQN